MGDLVVYESTNRDEEQYLEHIRQILKRGIKKSDRTGVGTISLFGVQMRYSLKNGKQVLSIYVL